MTQESERRETRPGAGGTTRRTFLAGAAAGAGGLIIGGAAGYAIAEAVDEDEAAPEEAAPEAPTSTEEKYPSGKDSANFIEHGETPLRIETRRELLGPGCSPPRRSCSSASACRFRTRRSSTTVTAGRSRSRGLRTRASSRSPS